MISCLCSDLWLEILSFIPIGDRKREWKMRVKEVVNLERVCSEIAEKVNWQVVFYQIAKRLMMECASEFWINYSSSFQLMQSIEEECLLGRREGNLIKKKYDRGELMEMFNDFRSDIDWRRVVKLILQESFVESYLVRLTETLISKIYSCGFFLRCLSCGFVTTREKKDLLEFRENLNEFNQDFVLSFMNQFIESKFNYRLLDIALVSECITEFDYDEISEDERFRRRLLDWWFNIARGCFKELRQCMKRRRFGKYQELKLVGTIQNSNVDRNYPTYHFKVSCILMMNNNFLIALIIPRKMLM
ncbi:Hypothetical protein NAEGRDRAFT_69269 [Naegleria gruberi]|uniref:Uncharacterized protein n=1 Tax=Naegleria gruberi TaxID=5762 RepID=D2VK49_NAEGR|nr:uncharacterized protein NAEGRDRAFT_69269 [Naegleria gruberi]EFC42801.1 Hypothetical protein NAEGRDRAFT_69269 [Naegleria gruberi]|eukprot:XP_002675545.1 Hypothetical protein NAEGRDRAFT_69269 [Naegleria gruberi strain NEG-M]